ncbi:MAG: hypothetical protein JNN20_04080, partial [Betaproteobacteria bacterium]|nr:hypothetical protein [Betaproteobacteria bacterium]
MESQQDRPAKLETAAEFGQRQIRETRKTRFWFGLIAGLIVGLLFLARIGRSQPVGILAVVAAVSIAIGVALFFSRRGDEESFGLVSFLLGGHSAFWQPLPRWVDTVLFAAL